MRAEELLDAILELGPTVKAAAVYPGSGEPVFRLRTGADQRSAVGGEYWEEAVSLHVSIALLSSLSPH